MEKSIISALESNLYKLVGELTVIIANSDGEPPSHFRFEANNMFNNSVVKIIYEDINKPGGDDKIITKAVKVSELTVEDVISTTNGLVRIKFLSPQWKNEARYVLIGQMLGSKEFYQDSVFTDDCVQKVENKNLKSLIIN